jgi:thiosulfate reductase cytochrome b subunit
MAGDVKEIITPSARRRMVGMVGQKLTVRQMWTIKVLCHRNPMCLVLLAGLCWSCQVYSNQRCYVLRLYKNIVLDIICVINSLIQVHLVPAFV